MDLTAVGTFVSEYRIWFIAGAAVAGAIWMIAKLVSRSAGQRQEQHGGAHSTNVQAGGNIHIGADSKKRTE